MIRVMVVIIKPNSIFLMNMPEILIVNIEKFIKGIYLQKVKEKKINLIQLHIQVYFLEEKIKLLIFN